MKKGINYLTLGLLVVVMAGCTDAHGAVESAEPSTTQTQVTTKESESSSAKESVTNSSTKASESEDSESKESSSTSTSEETKASSTEASASSTKESSSASASSEEQASENPYANNKKIEVDGGDRSGNREANVVVDIGYGDREYWGYTNEYGQLVYVTAEKITIQDDATEPVLSTGRYYSDEAKVPGVESDQLDEGHIIADSLGGVSNAYNITPQESTLNRHGDQAYMEEEIRKAGGATDFEATITYPDTTTQIPSHYHYTYILNGNAVVDDFDNINPDELNDSLGLTGNSSASSATPASSVSTPSSAPAANTTGDVSTVDANGNGQVTIQEAKDAGFSMPITSDHWLYQYMQDNDGDGMVGE
ncbi:MAG: DNA/RNA non-specific endonuclease [Enterococcus sp.]